MNKFEKVTYEQYKKDFTDMFEDVPEESIKTSYDLITMPKRGTKGSAGYDFVSPIGFVLEPGEVIKIPTGIRCQMESGIVLMLYPRSSIGFKYHVVLENTVGVIDEDYYHADNEGHIMLKLRNEGDKVFEVTEGDRLMQGIFSQYFVIDEDDTETERTGGIGSTGKN